MPAYIRWYEADGTTLAPSQLDWGFVGPGQSGETKTLVFKNEGDAPARRPELAVLAVGASDLEGWLTGTSGSETFTSAAPLPLPDLAVGAAGTITLTLNVPADAPLNTAPVLAQVGLYFDLEP